MKILHDRSNLIEGRTTGLAFGFVKDNKTLMPISPCKDYLNDFVYAENHKRKVTKYGFTHEYTGCYDNDDKIQLCFTYICDNELKSLKYYNKVLSKYYNTSIINFINSFEEKNNIPLSSIQKDGNYYILTADKKFWFASTIRISFYSFMVRLALRVRLGSTVDKFTILNTRQKQSLEFIQINKFKKVLNLITLDKYNSNPNNLNNSQIHNNGMMSIDNS